MTTRRTGSSGSSLLRVGQSGASSEAESAVIASRAKRQRSWANDGADATAEAGGDPSSEPAAESAIERARGARGGRRTSGESHRADGRGRASASWSQRREGLEPSTGQTDGPSDQTRRPTDNARRPSVQDRPLNLQPPKTPETADKTPNNLTDGTMMGFSPCRRPLSPPGKALKCLAMRAGARCKPPALQE